MTVACDGLEAIKKAMAEETSYSCQSNQFDIISAIDKMICDSPITWHWRHVKGHQDNTIGPLDRWASLNIEMDTAAKARRVIDEQDPPLIQHTIEHEMWRIYKQDSKGFTKISTKLDENLLEHIEGSALGKYLVNHFILSKKSLEEVDWDSLRKAREKKAFNNLKWATKWAAERLPTGAEMQDRGNWPDASCPRNCGEEMETTDHVYTCHKANTLWRKLQQILTEWAIKNNAAPGLLAAILSGLHQWRDHEDPIPQTCLTEEVKEAFIAQSAIGWYAASKGFLTKNGGTSKTSTSKTGDQNAGEKDL
jgi:hypothetical protein